MGILGFVWLLRECGKNRGILVESEKFEFCGVCLIGENV